MDVIRTTFALTLPRSRVRRRSDSPVKDNMISFRLTILLANPASTARGGGMAYSTHRNPVAPFPTFTPLPKAIRHRDYRFCQIPGPPTLPATSARHRRSTILKCTDGRCNVPCSPLLRPPMEPDRMFQKRFPTCPTERPWMLESAHQKSLPSTTTLPRSLRRWRGKNTRTRCQIGEQSLKRVLTRTK